MKLVSPVTDPLIAQANSQIPEDMKDFLDIQKIFEDLVNTFIGQPITTMVEKAYPPPK